MLPEGTAIVYCEGAFGTTNGKTAHGLVRRTRRYRIGAVIDTRHAGKDAGEVLDGKPSGIPILSGLNEAAEHCMKAAAPATHFVIGLAPDGGRLSQQARQDVLHAIERGLHVDCGLHDFLSDDPIAADLAAKRGVKIRDIRKTPPRSELHFFDGRIENVKCLKIAVLGTDSAIGKRTTAWVLVDGFAAEGHRAELVGTGQTAWMQGARYGVIMDSLINDFVAGEIEYAVWNAWNEEKPDAIIIEGQGSLMNPAYPGGFEILAAGRPDIVVLQHAPRREEYDGFPGYALHPIDRQIEAIEMISERKVVAITVNHEGMTPAEVPDACKALTDATGLPAFDVLLDGGRDLCRLLAQHLPSTGNADSRRSGQHT